MRRQVTVTSDKKASLLGHHFLEVEIMELEYELAFAAIFDWARSCWEGEWADDMYGAWKKQIFNASSLNKVRGLRERSAASSGMRACIDQRGTPLLQGIPYQSVR